MPTKYFGTIAGLCFGLPGLLSGAITAFDFFSFIALLVYLPLGLPLEIIGTNLFTDYATSAFFASFMLLIIFATSSYFYFSRLVADRDQNGHFYPVRFWGYFGLQLIVIHPLVFQFWGMAHAGSAGDGQFFFGVFESFPASSLIFIILGVAIDVVKNKPSIEPDTDT